MTKHVTVVLTPEQRAQLTQLTRAALYDRPRPGAAPKITGDVEAQLTVLACSTPPAGKARWTLRMLADTLVELKLVERMSEVAVHHRLKKTP